jgi:hypothetical protein
MKIVSTDESSQSAVAILLKYRTDVQARLEYGRRARQAMHKTISQGTEPTGYRPEWIKSTVRALFGFLASKSAEFNILWPQDRISSDDFADILNTAINKLKAS